MKHFYALMLMYVASVISGFAATNMYQLYIDHADRVSVSINGDVKNNLNDGLNNIFIDDVPSYGVYVSVSTISDDYGLESITNGNNEPVSIYSGNQASLVFDSSEASHYYKITTKNLLLARTSTLYVECDAPGKLTINFGGTYRNVKVDAEDQEIKFDPTTETTISLIKDYIEHFYLKQLNGVDLTTENYIAIKDGDKLKVSMIPPDIDYNYTITESETGVGFVTDVKVNGESVADIKSFKAHAGSKIEIFGNTDEYAFENMVIGENTISYFYSPYSMFALEDANITINARKYKDFDVEFDIDDPENVIIYTGYDPSDKFELVAGVQKFTFHESANSITINIISSSVGFLKSVLKNEDEIYEGSNLNYISIQEGDKFVIRTEKIVRDWKGMLYIEGLTNSHFLNFSSNFSHNSILTADAADGYNVFEFGNVDNPVHIGFMPKDGQDAKLFVNNEQINPAYEGSYSFELNLKDQDIVKIFVNGEPSLYSLSFNMPDDTEGISVRRDHITPITEFGASSTAHAGTIYHLTLPETETYSATLGDTPLTFDAENTAEFTPTADALLTVTKAVDGIENVTVGINKAAEIYNLQGIRVKDNATKLPAGIYIKDGKKFIVK